ncbi:MAG: cytochrome b [Caldimonas sp.]
MSTALAPPSRYDARSIALHWLTAALVVGLWLLGQTIDWFPKGNARVAARSVHIVLGVSLAFVLVLRIGWRFGGGTHLPLARQGWLDVVAVSTHRLLYALLVVTVLLGMTNAWVRGDTLFNLFTLPAFDPGNKSLRDTIENWHGLAADTLLVVALFHAGAGLLHHFAFKDDVLRRMLPPRRQG